MGLQDEKAQGFRIEQLQHLADGKEVAQRLAHLFAVDVHKAVVQPVVDKPAAIGPFRLGDLVFMVRKDQILTAAVDIKGGPQKPHAHGRAFDVPAGPPLAPG